MKSFLRTLLIAGGITLLMIYFMHPGEQAKTPPAPATTATAAGGATADVQPIPAKPLPAPTADEILTLGNAHSGSGYNMQVDVTRIGAGVQSVRLNIDKAAETTAHKIGYLLIEPPSTTQRPAFSVYRTFIDRSGANYATGQGTWSVRSYEKDKAGNGTKVVLYQRLQGFGPQDKNGNALRDAAGKLLPGPDLVEMERTYELDPGSYDLKITQRIKNLTDAPLTVTVDQLGPSQLPNDNVTDYRTYHGTTFIKAKGYIQADDKVEAQLAVAGEKADPTKYDLGSFQGDDHLVWVAASNSFFASIVRPLGLPGTPKVNVQNEFDIPLPEYLDKATAQPISIDHKVAGVTLQSRPLPIAAKGTAEIPLSVFLGPKDRRLLGGDIHAGPGTPAYEYYVYKYSDIIQYSRSTMCSFCTFSQLAVGILWLLDKIHFVTINYGVAIIVLVIVVRLALHPLTRYGQVNMARFQKQIKDLQPDLDRIKKKYKGAELREQQMKLYQEKKVNQAGALLGCLPMALQMPIWIALYSGLAADIDLRHAAFIPGWITDLSMPDTLAQWTTSFHIWILGYTHNDINYLPFNLLPILLGVAFFFQMRFQMRSQPAPADEQQAQMQKLSQYSILLFPLFLYNAPSGLNLYICASTAGGLFDTWLVRKQLRKEGLLPDQQQKPPKD